MTVKELYELTIEKGCENATILVNHYDEKENNVEVSDILKENIFLYPNMNILFVDVTYTC